VARAIPTLSGSSASGPKLIPRLPLDRPVGAEGRSEAVGPRPKRHVLILHSRYRSGHASGENRVVDDEVLLLGQGGHVVTTWTPSTADNLSGLDSARLARDALWSSEVRRIRELIERRRVDVIHVHNLFPNLSPAILRVAGESGIPVVVTLHNYRLLCLSATFLRDGAVCEACLGRTPWRGVLHRCYRRSAEASAVVASSLTLHRAIGTFGRVALYLAVSDLVRRKHLQGGFDGDRIIVKPNFAWEVTPREGPGDYFLYVGRLSPEKGVAHLLRGWSHVGAPLVIAGDGPDRSRLEQSAPDGVKFLGLVPGERIPGLIRHARAILLPSLNYEGAPRVIPEAYAAGVPVIASRMGAIPEFVDDEASGFLVEPGDTEALAQGARRLSNDALSVEMGRACYRLWQERYTPAQALDHLERAYSISLGQDGAP
jgi:glycosyltransferase involved in cell wall biosynthesis